MIKMNKVISLLKNRDMRSFMLFTLAHPGTILPRHSVQAMPPYMTENDFVDINKLETNYCIRKLSFPGTDSEPERRALLNSHTVRVHLAGIDDDIEINNINWFKNYEDPEDVAAMHRFSWLYRMVWENRIIDDSDANNIIKEIIYSWIDNVESKDKNTVHSEVWQTYSVVERLVSWTVILGLTEEKEDNDKKIISSIVRQLDYIQKNFEYYGEEFTSNHFCNNGRGLYICGAVLGINEFKRFGEKIIRNMLERIVPDNVFLREGSTHYQFLITKWICDCLWIGKSCEDHKFADWLIPRLKGLLSGCQYFMVQSENGWSIPLIGDISPDLTPSWLIGVPWVAEYLLTGKMYHLQLPEKGYHSILCKCVYDAKSNDYEGKCSIERSNDWERIISNSFRIYAHVNNSLYPNNLTGHFHHDSGSFVVYYDNLPLLIDCGRYNYNSDGVGTWMKKHFGHNVFIIDGFDPEPDMRSFYTKAFLKKYLAENPEIERKENCIVSIVYSGKRIRGIDFCRRNIEIINDSIVVRDDIEGAGIHDGMILFHISGIWDVKEADDGIIAAYNTYKFRIKSDNCNFKICHKNKGDNYYGYCSDEYGKLKQCISVAADIRFKVPYTIKTLIERI